MQTLDFLRNVLGTIYISNKQTELVYNYSFLLKEKKDLLNKIHTFLMYEEDSTITLEDWHIDLLQLQSSLLSKQKLVNIQQCISIENGKITFTKDGESKTFNYSSKGKDVMVIGGFEGVSVTYCTKEVQYVKVNESPKPKENDGNVIFYTNAHAVIHTPAFLVTTVFVVSTFVGALTTADYYMSQILLGAEEQTIEPPADNYETDASVLNIPMSEGEHSFYAFFGISTASRRMGVKGTFTITKGECTKIFLDAYKSTYDL